MSRTHMHRGTSQTAIVVRLIAFLVAAVSVLAIPTALLAATSGRVATLPALYAIGAAMALIVTAALTVRSFDPMRG